MNKEDGEKLVSKCMEVILSCKTEKQLINAIKYATLTYKKLFSETGLVGNMEFLCDIERSTGFALASIKCIRD